MGTKGKPPRFDVVLCGAGLSMGAPSSLPSGEALSHWVMRLLLDSQDVQAPGVVAPFLMKATTKLRLELLLEILSRHIPLIRLVEVYRSMENALPNRNH